MGIQGERRSAAAAYQEPACGSAEPQRGRLFIGHRPLKTERVRSQFHIATAQQLHKQIMRHTSGQLQLCCKWTWIWTFPSQLEVVNGAN